MSSCLDLNAWQRFSKSVIDRDRPDRLPSDAPAQRAQGSSGTSFRSRSSHSIPEEATKEFGTPAYRRWMNGADESNSGSSTPTRSNHILSTGLDSKTPFANLRNELSVHDEDEEVEDVPDSYWSPENLVARTLALGKGSGGTPQQLISGPVDISNITVEDWSATRDERPDRAIDQLWVHDFLTSHRPSSSPQDRYPGETEGENSPDLVSQKNRQPALNAQWDYARLFQRPSFPRPPTAKAESDLESEWTKAKTSDSARSTSSVQEQLKRVARSRLDLLGSHLGQDMSGYLDA